MHGMHDSNQIGPWSLWQGNLNAKILVVGQDWGDIKYFKKWSGKDQPHGNTTNENLEKLLQSIGIDIGKPHEGMSSEVFLTNIILCMKDGGLQKKIQDQWLTNCSKNFLSQLIDIIKPDIIISLGSDVTKSILDTFNVECKKSLTLSQIMGSSPFTLNSDSVLFPVYHCGDRGVNCNRKFEQQLNDWNKIGKYIDKKYNNSISKHRESSNGYVYMRFKKEFLSHYLLPDIKYPVKETIFNDVLHAGGNIDFHYLLLSLLNYSSINNIDNEFEKTITRLSEILIPDDHEITGTINTNLFSLKISKVDFNNELICITKKDKLLVAIQPTSKYGINISVFHALDKKSIEMLIDISRHLHPVHGISMRDNNWEYALDMAAPTLSSMYAQERNEACFSYWENGFLQTEGNDKIEFYSYLSKIPLKPHVVAAQIGVIFELDELWEP